MYHLGRSRPVDTTFFFRGWFPAFLALSLSPSISPLWSLTNVYQLSCCLGGRRICLGKRTGEACRGAAKLPPERRFLDGRRPDAREARCPFRADSRLQLPQGTPLPLPWYGRRAVPCTVEPCPTIATEHRAHCPYSPGLQERPSRSQCVRGESTSPIPLGAARFTARRPHACTHTCDARPAPTARSLHV